MQEFNHERTPQKVQQDPTDKEALTQLWQQHADALNFVEAGYVIAPCHSRRPFRVITPNGNCLKLLRQLDTIDTKEFRFRLPLIESNSPGTQ